MKSDYLKPLVEIEYFESKDVVTTSIAADITPDVPPAAPTGPDLTDDDYFEPV